MVRRYREEGQREQEACLYGNGGSSDGDEDGACAQHFAPRESLAAGVCMIMDVVALLPGIRPVRC